MKRFGFGPQDAFTPHDERLENVTISPLTAPGPAQAAIFRLGAGGRIGRHPAVVPQVLAVVDGSGLVSGGDGDHGLTALIVEATGLRPLG